GRYAENAGGQRSAFGVEAECALDSVDTLAERQKLTYIGSRQDQEFLAHISLRSGARPTMVAPRTGRSRLPAGPRIEPFEERQPVLEDLMVVGIRGKKPSDHEIDAARLVARELAVPQISLMYDLGEAGQAAIPKPGTLEERLEGAVLPHVAELGPGRIEGNGLRPEILWIGEQERRLGVHEPPHHPPPRQPAHPPPT